MNYQTRKRKEFYKNCLKPLSNKKLVKYDFVGFDVETTGDNNDFYMGGLYWYKGKTEKYPTYKAFYDRNEMVEFLLTKKFQGKYIIATNLDFDLTKLFYKTKYWNELNRLESGGRLIHAEYKPKHWQKIGKIKFIDTTNYVFFSVEKAGELLGIPKKERPSSWEKKVINGVVEYDIKKPKNKFEIKELEEYNMYDCKISCDFGYFLQKGFNEAGGNLKITMASTSFDVWRRGYLDKLLVKEKYVLKDESINDFILSGYYGGRTEVFKKGFFDKVFYYDINSLYPSVMKNNKFPLPNTVIKPIRRNKKNIMNYEGVSEVVVKCPDINRPFLPKKVNGKLCFPSGTFKNTYNHCELRKAIELGYEILKVKKQIIYMQTFDPFSKFVDYFYNKRNKYKEEHNPMEIPMKLIMNSLYGKFGQKKINVCEYIDVKQMKTYEELEKRIKGKEVTEKNGYIIVNEEKKYNGKNSFPILASYVTSYARILMYDYISNENVIYTDTDSIITTEDLSINSKELGLMKLEGVYDEAYIMKPKLYKLKNEDETIIKAKGIRKVNEEDFNNIIKGNKVRKPKLAKFKESVRRGLNPYQKMVIEKVMNRNDDKRVWNSDGTSKPLTVVEVET